MALRGALGKAALNPWRQVARAACNADRAGRAHVARANASRRLDRSRWPSCFGKRESAGGPRKRVDRGIASLSSLTRRRIARRNRSTGSRVSALLLGKRRRFPAGLAAIARQEVLERIESGQSSIDGRRPARRPRMSRVRSSRIAGDSGGGRRRARAAPPLAREHSADDERNASSDTIHRACASSRVGIGKRGYALSRRHRDAAVGATDGAPTPLGACSQSSASWACRIDAVGRRSNGPWLCS